MRYNIYVPPRTNPNCCSTPRKSAFRDDFGCDIGWILMPGQTSRHLTCRFELFCVRNQGCAHQRKDRLKYRRRASYPDRHANGWNVRRMLPGGRLPWMERFKPLIQPYSHSRIGAATSRRLRKTVANCTELYRILKRDGYNGSSSGVPSNKLGSFATAVAGIE